jgi:hypothetical protein
MNTAAIDSAAARAQAFEDMPVTEVPIAFLLDRKREAEKAVAYAQAELDIISAIVRIRSLEGIDRTREIIAKFYP